jgi:hypothetical protein
MLVSGQINALAALPQEKSSWYQMIKRPGGSQGQYGHGNKEDNPYLCRESNPYHPAHSHSTELVREICRCISRHKV